MLDKKKKSKILPPIAVDKENNSVKLSVNSKIYSLETIYAAGYLFLDKVYILLDEGRNGHIDVYLFPQGSSMDLKKTAFEFYNELLNYSHYFSRAKMNADTAKLILQRAFFSLSPEIKQESEDQEIKDLLSEFEKEKFGKNSRVNKK